MPAPREPQPHRRARHSIAGQRPRRDSQQVENALASICSVGLPSTLAGDSDAASVQQSPSAVSLRFEVLSGDPEKSAGGYPLV